MEFSSILYIYLYIGTYTLQYSATYSVDASNFFVATRLIQSNLVIALHSAVYKKSLSTAIYCLTLKQKQEKKFNFFFINKKKETKENYTRAIL